MAGFHIRFENWLPCRATTFNATRGQLLVARQEEMVGPGNWATGYVKPCMFI